MAEMIVIDEYDQMSPEWFAEKTGKPSSSKFSEIVTSKGKPSASAGPYMYRLAGEYIRSKKTKVPGEKRNTSYWERRGLELQNDAIACFEFYTDLTVRPVAICYPDEQKKYLCSPDALVNEEPAGLEIKCRSMSYFIKHKLDNRLPTMDTHQVQGSLLVCEKKIKYWYYMSYYPDMTPLILKVYPDRGFIENLRKELDRFCLRLSQIIKDLQKGG
jgi:hypothetical protein